VLIDLALGAPNLSVISSQPNAPGIVDLVAGTAHLGDIITRDQLSTAHLIAAGQQIKSPDAILRAPSLGMMIEALAQSYDHVILDGGAVPEADVERFGQLAQLGVLVAAKPADPQSQAAQKRLEAAGFTGVTLLVADGG